ncbi:AraC family transcriptional regulator [Cohnella fermenti]|uniref:Helix-turn-helix transcriptional regulator n=1 Tax=Cohnella fermenti TaxID=2565925 RepID=A0A4S4C3A2_9BACL|nr:AraC family transcriptional regulator [Cohnella fermenti]THF81635.1 helix-turn-helix transcriptional regulator [Cohnella fermenti]
MKNDVEAIAREFAEGVLTIKAVHLGAMKPNVHYPENTSDEPIALSGLLFVIRGRAMFKFDGKAYELKAGKAVHGAVGMKLRHQVTGPEDLEYLLVHYELWEPGSESQNGIRYNRTSYMMNYGNQPTTVEKMYLLNQAWNTPGQLTSVRCKELFFGLVHDMLSAARGGSVQVHRGEIDDVVSYIQRFYMEPHTVDSLAARCGMNAKRFSYLFNKYTGMFPIDYLIRHRLDRAKQLLATSDCAILQVAGSVGYADTHYFSRLFKKNEGCSPGEYRRRLGNRPLPFR